MYFSIPFIPQILTKVWLLETPTYSPFPEYTVQSSSLPTLMLRKETNSLEMESTELCFLDFGLNKKPFLEFVNLRNFG